MGEVDNNEESCKQVCSLHGLEHEGCVGEAAASPHADVNILVIPRCHSGGRDIQSSMLWQKRNDRIPAAI